MTIFERLHTRPPTLSAQIEQDMILTLATHVCLHDRPPSHKTCGPSVVCVDCQRYALSIADEEVS